MFNTGNKSMSRISAHNRNRTSYAEHIEGLTYTYPFNRGDIVYFAVGSDPERSKRLPKIVVEVGVPVKKPDGTYVEGMRVKHSDGFPYVPGYQETVKVSSFKKYSQEDLDNYEGIIG